VIFSIQDETAEVDCAAYEPTGELRKVASELIEGDQLEVHGAVRREKSRLLTLNLEKINILSLAPSLTFRNPTCPFCGKRGESMGKGQGFRCKKCGAKLSTTEKTKVTQQRRLKPGLYVTSPSSQRHLTKPLRRYGLEKNQREKVNIIKDWHS
jgi:tRNA(Ile2)-agmatinylcytidine synthase